MKTNFKEQFQNIRNIIQTNVSTLQSLLTQSENLATIIQSLNNSPENAELKKQLEELKQKISDSIQVLIEQTKKLFVAYDKLVEEVFG